MLNIVMAQVASFVEAPAPELENLSLDVTQLLEAWEEAKAQELTANQRRQSIEQQLCVQLAAPEEGQKSHRVGPYKITRTNKVLYRGDIAKIRAVTQELGLPSLLKDALNETAIKRLRREDEYDFELLVAEGCLTISPAKPHFEVVRVPTAILVET